MSPGQLLRDARRRHGLTQRQLAARVRTSQAAISRVERDLVSPSVATLATDGDTGLPSKTITIGDFVANTRDRRSDTHSPSRGDYFVGPETTVEHYRPIEPVTSPIDLTTSGKLLHDGLVVSLPVSAITQRSSCWYNILPPLNAACSAP